MTAGGLVHKRTFVLAALVAGIGALVLAAFLVQQAGPRAAGAADHLDAPMATPPPGGDGIGKVTRMAPAGASRRLRLVAVTVPSGMSDPLLLGRRR